MSEDAIEKYEVGTHLDSKQFQQDIVEFPAAEFSIYSNVNGFRLVFGRIGFGKIPIKYIAAANMSPQTAKQLAILLSEMVDEYENAFGEIKLYPSGHPDNVE